MVLQLVSPGGQAALSLTFCGRGGTRKTIFPDLILMTPTAIVIGECKPYFSKVDYDKLVELNEFGKAEILSFWNRRKPIGYTSAPLIQMVLCHASRNPIARPIVYQWVMQGDIFEVISPSVGDGS